MLMFLRLRTGRGLGAVVYRTDKPYNSVLQNCPFCGCALCGYHQRWSGYLPLSRACPEAVGHLVRTWPHSPLYCSKATSVVLSGEAAQHSHLSPRALFRPGGHGKITPYHKSLPLLGGQFVGSLLLLLQTPAGLFQLGQGVRGWIGWHCGILDEKMRRLDRVPKLSTDPGMHGPRTFNGQRPGALMDLLLPHPRRPWGKRTVTA